MRVAILLACSACTIAEKQVAPDLACADDSVPATAPPRVTISGVVRDIAGNSLGPGIAVQGFASGLPLPPVATDDAGAFRYSQDTGGAPNLHSISTVAPDFIPTVTFVGRPIAGNEFVDVRMVGMSDAMDFAEKSGVIFDPSLGVILLRVSDCNESPLAGGTVTADVTGDIYYFRLSAPDVTATDTDASGVVLMANLPLGEVTLSGAVAGLTLKSHGVTTMPGAFVLTLMQP